jgi:hypothetical protein
MSQANENHTNGVIVLSTHKVEGCALFSYFKQAVHPCFCMHSFSFAGLKAYLRTHSTGIEHCLIVYIDLDTIDITDPGDCISQLLALAEIRNKVIDYYFLSRDPEKLAATGAESSRLLPMVYERGSDGTPDQTQPS